MRAFILITTCGVEELAGGVLFIKRLAVGAPPGTLAGSTFTAQIRGAMDFAEVRRLTIIALFSDDRLFEQIVLKGGNALNLIYALSPRTSLDLDFSIENDFADLDDTRKRIFRAIRGRFSSAGFVVFDESFGPKPQAPTSTPGGAATSLSLS